MRKSKRLEDAAYDDEIERMSNLAKFPAVPAARNELRRALRRISEADKDFIHDLISDVIDTNTICPTAADLLRRAGDKRSINRASLGNPDCESCHGSGWIQVTVRVSPPRVAPYDAETSKPCACRGGRAAPGALR